MTSVSDAGAGSFRQAILGANAATGSSTIDFDIPGTGVQSIALATPLPALINPTIIDATTQPGYAGTPLVEIEGANILDTTVTPATPIPAVNGLSLTGGLSTVKGLAIDRFTGSGIVATRDGNTFASDFIGTDPTGTEALGNGGDGIAVSGRNNVIGTSGSPAILGVGPNVISGNLGSGIFLGANSGLPTNNVVEGNKIGTDVTGTLDLGNSQAGIDVESSDNIIGGITAGTGNTIAFNGGPGVQVGSNEFSSAVIQDRITGNSIFNNVGLGIDLGGDGVTTGYPGGTSFGPNGLIAFPTLTSSYAVSGGTEVEGTLAGAANTSYTVDFYSNTQAGRSGYGEGRTPIGSQSFTTNASGVADITTLLLAVPAGEFLSATTTDSAGNTSEFSRALAVTATAESDLSLAASNPNPSAQAGVAQTYYYTVQNNGPSKATNVVFTDVLPAGATFQSGTTGQGTLVQSNGTVTVDVGSLASGSTTTIALTYTLTLSGSALNQASVTADQADPTPANNTITQNFQVIPASPTDLSLFGVANPFPGQVGQPLTYTFVVTNNSFNPATGVMFTDPLPSSLVVQSVRSSQGTSTTTNNDVTVALGNLPGGSNATVTIVAIPTTPGSVTNFAMISGNEPDLNAINNSTTIFAYITPPPTTDVAVAITAAPMPAAVGQPFAYDIIVGDPGTAQATGVVMTDVLTDAASVVSIKPSQGSYTLVGDVLTVNFGTLAIGAQAEVTVSLIPGAPGFITNSASVVANEPEFNISNNYASLATAVIGQAFPPAILDQKLTLSGNAITNVVLTFNEALDVDSAQTLANYEVEDLGSKGYVTATGPSVGITSATYNTVARSVTLTFAKPLSIGRFYKLIVNGKGAPGLVDTNGNVLDGENNTLQNGIYQSLIGRGTSTRPVNLQVGVPAPKNARPAKPVKSSVKVVHPTTVKVVVQKAAVKPVVKTKH